MGYKAEITVPGEGKKHLGYYDTAEDAARVHAGKYLKIHGAPPYGSSATGKKRQRDEGNGGADGAREAASEIVVLAGMAPLAGSQHSPVGHLAAAPPPPAQIL